MTGEVPNIQRISVGAGEERRAVCGRCATVCIRMCQCRGRDEMKEKQKIENTSAHE